MPVFTIESLREAIGEKQLMLLVDLDRDGVIGEEEEDRANRLILVGQADIDTRIKGKFQTPLDEMPPEYKEAVLDCVIYRLQPRGKLINTDAKERFDVAIRWAKDVKCDDAQLTSEEQPGLRRSPAAKNTGDGRLFTRAKLASVL